jgi:hypothetical protein
VQSYARAAKRLFFVLYFIVTECNIPFALSRKAFQPAFLNKGHFWQGFLDNFQTFQGPWRDIDETPPLYTSYIRSIAIILQGSHNLQPTPGYKGSFFG